MVGGRFLDLTGGTGGTNRWGVFSEAQFCRQAADSNGAVFVPAGSADPVAGAPAPGRQPGRYEEF